MGPPVKGREDGALPGVGSAEAMRIPTSRAVPGGVVNDAHHLGDVPVDSWAGGFPETGGQRPPTSGDVFRSRPEIAVAGKCVVNSLRLCIINAGDEDS